MQHYWQTLFRINRMCTYTHVHTCVCADPGPTMRGETHCSTGSFISDFTNCFMVLYVYIYIYNIHTPGSGIAAQRRDANALRVFFYALRDFFPAAALPLNKIKKAAVPLSSGASAHQRPRRYSGASTLHSGIAAIAVDPLISGAAAIL